MKKLGAREITDILVEEICAVSGLRPEEISVENGFLELGVESLQAIAIIEKVGQRIGRKIETSDMFNYPSILSLSFYLGHDEKIISEEKHIIQDISIQSAPAAIIGMSCRFPKAPDLEHFYDLLSLQIDAIQNIGERWGHLGNRIINQVGAVAHYDEFAADVFGISDNEALKIDPQQRLVLEEVWSALEDAGYSPSELRGSATGVFVGISSSDYAQMLRDDQPIDIFSATGNAHSIAANRVSYFYDFLGPSVAVDTACSSSLVAIDMALKALNEGYIDLAVVAGVNLVLNPDLSEAFAQAMMLSPDGRCFSFSDKANGYVRGEGVGVVVLRRVSEAEKNGDRIYSVIKSSAVNQDGKSNGLTAPNGRAQEAVMAEALKKAKLKPEDIQYHEAHGTATPLGDPVELLALEKVHSTRPFGKPLMIGSVKTNIGHLEAAAGMAGLIKASLSLHHKMIFPNLHFGSLNRQVAGKVSHLKISTELTAWQFGPEPRNASVSAFGFGGTNAHVILQEFIPSQNSNLRQVEARESVPTLLGFSSNTMLATENNLSLVKQQIATMNWPDIQNYAQATLAQRMSLQQRILLSATNKEELLSLLDEVQSQRPHPKILKAVKRNFHSGRIALLFTGQGSQYSKMYFPLYRASPDFQKRVDYLLRLAQKYFPLNLFQVWTEEKWANELQQTDYGQVLLFILELCFANTLRSKYGIKVDVVFGHSLGEIIAAAYSGILQIEDALKMVAYRGRLMRRTALGAMTAVFAAKISIDNILNQSDARIDYAAHNGPQMHLLSGAELDIIKIEGVLQKGALKFRRMPVHQAFHSYLMEPILNTFEESIRSIKSHPTSLAFVSSQTGELVDSKFIFTPEYWKNQLRHPTQFEKAFRTLETWNVQTCLEVGPQGILNGMAQRFSQIPKMSWTHFFNKQEEGLDSFTNGCARIVAEGAANPPSTERNFALLKTHFHKESYIVHSKSLQGDHVSQSHHPASGSVQRTNEIIQRLVDIIASVMRVSAEEISVDENLVNIGADSLVLMNAIQTIKDNYQVSIPVSEVFKDLNTIRKIAEYVAQVLASRRKTTEPVQVSNNAAQTLSFEGAIFSQNSSANELLTVIQNQMALMSQHLQLLQGRGISPAPTNSPEISGAVRAHQFENIETEKRGVLGSFKTFANAEKNTAESAAKAQHLLEFIRKFNLKTKKTKAHVQKYRKVLADNRVSAGFRPNTKEMIYPIHCHKARGSCFTDMDGNDYVDFTMGFGVNLFGHSPDFIEEAIREQIQLGMCVGPQSFQAGEVAQLVSELTGLERVAFVNSGTEAVMTAIRLARAGTKRTKIVIFDGSYHGHFDGVLARGTKDLKSLSVAAGIPGHMVEDVVVLEYGNEKSLRVIEELGHELAAVLIEPVQSRFPENQPRQFLHELRRITQEKGIAFIWDEVITGFRIHPGGAQAHFGIKADIAAYGKILGGGMPIGAVAGKSQFLDFIDGGDWQFGDESYPKNEMTFFAGTFSKHPMAMAASLAVLQKLKREGLKIISSLNKRTEKLCLDLNEHFKRQGLDLRMVHFGSLFRFKGPLNLDLFFASLNEKGFYIWEGRNLFMSTAHTDEEIKSFQQAVIDTLEELMQVGHFSSASSDLSLIPHQRRFLELSKSSDFGESASHVCISAKVKGHLDVKKLREAFNILGRSRDLFRWRLKLASERQWFTHEDTDIDFEFVDVRTETAPWRAVDKRLFELAQRPFHLEKDIAMLVKLFEVAEETHVLSVICHHMAFDGWTMTLFFEDLATVYNALLAERKPEILPTLSFEKFLRAENVWAMPAVMKAAENFWLNEVANFIIGSPFVGLATQSHTAHQGQRLVFDLELKLYEGLKKWCKAQKLTPFMFLLGAFARTLMNKLDKSEIIIGIPAANRDYQGSDKMYGNCANLLPIQMKLVDQGNEIYFKQAKEKIINAYQHMIYPFESLKEKKGPLFEVYFNLEPTSDLPEFDQASLIIHPFPIAASEYPLMLNITDFEHYYHCEFDFQWAAMTDDFVLELIEDLKREIRRTVITKAT